MEKETISDQNQSGFTIEQEELQAPPEIIEAANQPKKPLSKKNKMILIGVGLFSLLIFIMILVQLMSQKSTPQQQIIEASPSPTPQTIQTQTEKELQIVDDQVKIADPSIQDFAPPPVDMNVTF